MNELIPFDYQGNSVRVIDIDNEPWFVLADVTKILGLSQFRADRLDEDMIQNHPLPTAGGIQQTRIVSESGFYEVVVRSDSPIAKPFRRWVTHDVLPQIRKTGSYGSTPQLTEAEIVHQALQITARQVRELENRVTELEPKAARFDDWLGAKGDYTFTEASKVLQRDHNIILGGRRLIETLINWGWVYRINRPRSGKTGPVSPYQAQLDTGRFTVRATTYVDQYTGDVRAADPQTRVTPKGVHDIAERLTRTALAA